MNTQYTEDWFENEFSSHRYDDCNDILSLKKRMEHLPKMMDTINEILKEGTGNRKEISNLVYNIDRYVKEIAYDMNVSKYACMIDPSGKYKAKTY